MNDVIYDNIGQTIGAAPMLRWDHAWAEIPDADERHPSTELFS